MEDRGFSAVQMHSSAAKISGLGRAHQILNRCGLRPLFGSWTMSFIAVTLFLIFAATIWKLPHPYFPCHISHMLLYEPARTVACSGFILTAAVWLSSSQKTVGPQHRRFNVILKWACCVFAFLTIAIASAPGTEMWHVLCARLMFVCLLAYIAGWEYYTPCPSGNKRRIFIAAAVVFFLVPIGGIACYGAVFQVGQPRLLLIDLELIYEAYRADFAFMRFLALMQWLNVVCILVPLSEYLAHKPE